MTPKVWNLGQRLTWQLVTYGNSQAPPTPPESENLGPGPSSRGLSNPAGVSDTRSGFRSAGMGREASRSSNKAVSFNAIPLQH